MLLICVQRVTSIHPVTVAGTYTACDWHTYTASVTSTQRITGTQIHSLTGTDTHECDLHTFRNMFHVTYMVRNLLNISLFLCSCLLFCITFLSSFVWRTPRLRPWPYPFEHVHHTSQHSHLIPVIKLSPLC